jgi:hypothetical protein
MASTVCSRVHQCRQSTQPQPHPSTNQCTAVSMSQVPMNAKWPQHSPKSRAYDSAVLAVCACTGTRRAGLAGAARRAHNIEAAFTECPSRARLAGGAAAILGAWAGLEACGASDASRNSMCGFLLLLVRLRATDLSGVAAWCPVRTYARVTTVKGLLKLLASTLLVTLWSLSLCALRRATSMCILQGQLLRVFCKSNSSAERSTGHTQQGKRGHHSPKPSLHTLQAAGPRPLTAV